jgi:WD40 repeat protein
MPDSVEQAGIIVKKIQEIVGILKYSPTETATALVAVLCFSAAAVGLSNEFVKPLFGSYVEPVRIVLFAVSALLIALTGLRIWKLAIPPVLPPQETRPSAIKGPMPFTREDGELFRSLGREAELKSLLTYVLDEQIPLAVVMGESGVGKTSLLRAGLSQALEQRQIRLIYWEALSMNPTDRLVHSIQAYWDHAKDGSEPKNISDAINALSASAARTVIVLDQFEQLSPENSAHHELFEIVKRFATSAMTPYRLTFVVAFRREYDPLWRDFELTIPDFHPPMLSLRLFEKNQARGIIVTLATAANFTLDSDLATDVANSAADRNGRVSPVDIGIGMLVLSGLAIRKDKKHLNKVDYRFAGGAEGILTAYVSDRLERLSEWERQGVIKALLALCNLDSNQRIAEGKTVDDLSTAAQLPSNRLVPCLEYFASPHVRLLERLLATADSAKRYRLPHDRIVASIRRLTSIILAEANQAQLILENAFRAWLNGRRGRYLLTGSDLKIVLRHSALLYGATLSPDETTFLRLSLRKRLQHRIAGGGLLCGFIVLLILMTFYWVEHKRESLRRESDTLVVFARSALAENDNPRRAAVALDTLTRAVRSYPYNSEASALIWELLIKNTWCPARTPPLYGNGKLILSAAFGHQGSGVRVLAISSDGWLLGWDGKANSLSPIQSLSNADHRPLALLSASFSPNRNEIFLIQAPSGGGYAEAQFWHWQNDHFLLTKSIKIEDYGNYNWIAWSADEKLLMFVSARWDHIPLCRVFHRNSDSYEEVREPFGTVQVLNVAISPIEDMAATASLDGTVQLWKWDGNAFQALQDSPGFNGSLHLPEKTRPISMTFTSDGNDLIATAFLQSSPQGILYILNFRKGVIRPVQSPTVRDQFMQVALGPRNATRHLVATSLYRRVLLSESGDLDLMKPVAEPICFRGQIASSPVFSDDGNELLTLSGEGWGALDAVQVWDVSLKVLAENKADSSPPSRGSTPKWLPDLALGVTGTVEGGDGENHEFLTLEEIQRRFNAEAPGGKYAKLWLHFFPQNN